MERTNADASHTLTCEDGPDECATCRRIVAERVTDARIADENAEHATRARIGWLANGRAFEDERPGRCQHAGGLACRKCE